jgi:DNA-binding transcriptional LysR family regulator
MLELYAESKETIGNQFNGTQTIGTIDSLAAYYLPRYLQKLKKQFPELSIQLQPEQETVILSKVKEGEFDIGFLMDRNSIEATLN